MPDADGVLEKIEHSLGYGNVKKKANNDNKNKTTISSACNNNNAADLARS